MAVSWGMSEIKNLLTSDSTTGILGAIGSAAGSVLSWAGDFFDSIELHEGGFVGKGGEKAFGNLAPNEVLAVLERGEMVLTAEQTAALYAMLQGAGVGIGAGPGVTGFSGTLSPNAQASIIGAVLGLAKGGFIGPISSIGDAIVGGKPGFLGELGYNIGAFLSGQPSLSEAQAAFDAAISQAIAMGN